VWQCSSTVHIKQVVNQRKMVYWKSGRLGRAVSPQAMKCTPSPMLALGAVPELAFAT
jgi:hypothetical protein